MSVVVHLRTTAGLYGADQVLLSLASAAGGAFAPVVIHVLRPGHPPVLADAARAAGHRTVALESHGRLDGPLALRLAGMLVDLGAAVLHAHDPKALVLGLGAGRLAGVPVVATFHGDTGATGALILYERLARLSANLTAGVAAVSRPLARAVARWAPFTRVLHIPNGIGPAPALGRAERRAAREAFGLADAPCVAAVVGRLSREKGHRVLADALLRMQRRLPVLVAGDGPERQRLQVWANRVPLRLLGYQRDVRRVYAAADLIVVPSLTEGLPRVALEAMALGVPVVASAVGDLPELLGEGAGLTVPSCAPDALAGALEALASSVRLRRDLSRAGLQRVRTRYSLTSMAAAYVQGLYGPALAEARAGDNPGRQGARPSRSAPNP